MPHALKGQSAKRYRPSATRRNSGLSPIAERRAVELWNKVRQAVKKVTKTLHVNRGSPGYNFVAKKGRFNVYSPARYIVNKKGRFNVLTRLSPKKPSRFSISTRYF
jgi:hypothetical protein